MPRNAYAIDPVCGQPVAEATALSSEYRSRRYFFCSRRCRRSFERGAEQAQAAERARLGALFGRQRAAFGLA
ncbi:MAG TPA: YHS domain-containing protein [Anaeromyxobacter sp.]|nr:YHS domain-containing protein [Anaeromyxobacter sp.]